MTASDARPPSDTGTTGWHTHSGRAAYRDDQCARHDDDVNPARPVLVVDPDEAHDGAVAEVVALTGCSPTLAKAVLTRVLAALAGQEQP